MTNTQIYQSLIQTLNSKKTWPLSVFIHLILVPSIGYLLRVFFERKNLSYIVIKKQDYAFQFFCIFMTRKVKKKELKKRSWNYQRLKPHLLRYRLKWRTEKKDDRWELVCSILQLKNYCLVLHWSWQYEQSFTILIHYTGQHWKF